MATVFRGLAHTLEAVTSECSDFNVAWKEAEERPTASRWEGEWRSNTNGHHGALRCVLKRENDKKAEAFFRAKYSRFLRACYRVTLVVSKEQGRELLRGSTDLGPLAGGIYEYEGWMSGEELTCRYKCKYDEGRFSLRRVAER